MSREIVLVTGCSSGFGLLTAVRAAKGGYRVIATMRNLGARSTLDDAARAAGVTLDVRALDIDHADAMPAFVETIEREVGPIDILVNNAGFGMGGAVYDLAMDELRAQFDTNFFGTIALTKAVLPAMIKRKRGLIMQISSNSARHPTPGVGAYAASKAALEAMTEALRLELATFNIRVTCIQPGMFRTDGFTKRRLARAFGDESSPFHAFSERGLSRIDKMVERSAGDPAKVADRVVRMFEDPAPPLRLVIGMDAKMQTIARALLPAPLWERIIRNATGF